MEYKFVLMMIMKLIGKAVVGGNGNDNPYSKDIIRDGRTWKWALIVLGIIGLVCLACYCQWKKCKRRREMVAHRVTQVVTKNRNQDMMDGQSFGTAHLTRGQNTSFPSQRGSPPYYGQNGSSLHYESLGPPPDYGSIQSPLPIAPPQYTP